MRSQSERVGVFVDVQNYFYGARDEHNGGKVNYSEFMKYAVDNRSLIRGVAYMVEKEGSNSDSFKSVLYHAGFEIRNKILIEREDGSRKGNWDIAIAVDAMSIGPRVDTVILASGDGDFVYLVDYLKNIGCRVEVISFERSTSKALINAATEWVPVPADIII